MISSNRFRAIMLAAAFLVSSAVACAESFSFAHITDTHIKGPGKFADNLTAIVNEINAMDPRPAFVIATGDLTEMGFTEEYEKYNEIMSALLVPLYNVAGNHEAKWSNWGKAGARKFLKQDPYYSFDHGGVHFIGLDSTMWLEHNGFLDQSQLNWLKNDLNKIGPTTPVILFYHHAPGFLPNEDQLLRMLRPYNVPMVLVGHGHSFKTWKRNGIVFQMTKGAMNDEGGYRLLKVENGELQSFRKLTGKDAADDGVISLKPGANRATLISPHPGMQVDTPVHIRASLLPNPSQDGKVEAGVGDDLHPVTPGTAGIIDVTRQYDGDPGWQKVSIRATDSDGVQWSDSATVKISPKVAAVKSSPDEVWRVPVSGAVQRPVTAYGDRIYFGAWGGDVYCLDAATGRQVWKQNVASDVMCRIAVEDGLAYLGGADGKVFALNASTGDIVWKFQTDGPVQGSPTLGDGAVFIDSGDHGFYALDAKTGRIRWGFRMDRMAQCTPLYMNGVVYYGAWDQRFYAINTRDASVRWITPIGDLIYFSPANSNPATDGSRIVVAATPWHASDPDIFCLDMQTGKIIWKRRNPGEKSHCAFNTPCVAGDRFYIASLNGGLYCMSMADGKEIWTADIKDETYDNSPVVADGKLYIGGLSGGVHCFHEASGKKLWTYSTGGEYLFGSPTVWKDTVIVPSTAGFVAAIKAVD